MSNSGEGSVDPAVARAVEMKEFESLRMI